MPRMQTYMVDQQLVHAYRHIVVLKLVIQEKKHRTRKEALITVVNVAYRIIIYKLHQ